MKIILLSGPPGCGKDTFGSMLEKALWVDAVPNSMQLKFAGPIKEFFKNTYCHGDQAEFEWYEKRENKDIPHDALMGKTPREIQIAYSEMFMKPFHGSDIWGRMLGDKIQYEMTHNEIEYFIVTDLGFESEYDYLQNRYGSENIIIIEIRRKGCDFSKDSRNFIDPKVKPSWIMSFHNDYSFDWLWNRALDHAEFIRLDKKIEETAIDTRGELA
jgi:hypothetical protein